MAGGERRVITVGGKGSSLSSVSVFEVSNGLAHVRIDSSSPLANSTLSPSLSSSKSLLSIPNYLTSEEARSSLLLLLNNLVLSSSSSSSPAPSIAAFAAQLSDGLNLKPSNGSGTNSSDLVIAFDVPEQDLVGIFEFDYPLAALRGICALLDHRISALLTVVDAVAALSCEALKADVSAFDLMDSGDGSSAKDEVAVASDLKVLLNGSKLAGKLDQKVNAVSEIPGVHGSLREIARLVHSRVRVELNSGAKCGGFRSTGTGKALVNVLSPLALALRNLGENSWRRTKLIVESIGNDDLRSCLMEMLDKRFPGFDSLKDLYRSSQASLEEDYIKFSHYIFTLSEIVRMIVSWEIMTAFVSLEASELIGKIQYNESSSGENSKAKKKSDKEKKFLGKGTIALTQFIMKDRLQKVDSKAVDNSILLQRRAEDFLSMLDPKDSGFDNLLNNVKEIVESNESRRLPKLPKGTRDFAKEQMAVREKAFSVIGEVFKRHGAMALDTPVFELRETLMGKYGEDSKLIYDLADQGGELCSLRYDLTVPFARYVAMNGLTSFKRYQIAKVYRRDNPSKGRYREFYQCDFDIAGQYETMGPDFEVIKILTELLDGLNIGDYEVKLNHRKLLDGMLEICGVPEEKFRSICSSIDKLDKLTFEQIKTEMVGEKGITMETADKIGTFVKERGSPLELLSRLKQDGSTFLENKNSLIALNDLEILFKALDKSKCIDKVVFDLSLARGLDYYTGVIFEAVFKGATQVGSIAAGGRYDNLIGMFSTKRQVPAVGISLGIERVFTIMEQLQRDQNQAIRATETQALVSILGDDLSVGAELVSKLWGAKIKAEFMVNKRVMKHIDRARESRIPWMVIVGERELNEGIVKLKDVVASIDYDVPINTIVEELQRRLDNMSP